MSEENIASVVIKSIRKIGTEETYDIKVNPNNNVFLDNGILSHNSGKSTLAKSIARYVCPWFNEKYIAFRDSSGNSEVVDGFIEITTNCPEYSSAVLDESFASLNTKVGMSPEFLRILNHIQIIRQKHLFMILCLPNFFDLSKSLAIFRSSHLFVTYANDEGDRGRFNAYGPREKSKLYIKGNRYMDYGCVQPNFHGRFTRNPMIIDEKVYEAMKIHHLKTQDQALIKKEKENPRTSKMARAIYLLYTENKMKVADIAHKFGIGGRDVYNHLENVREKIRRDPKYIEKNE